MGCGADREVLCCPATVGATKAAGKPLLNGFANLDFLIRLQPKTCPEQSRRIENLKSEIIGWEGAATRLDARARRPIRLPQHAPFVGEGGFR